MTDTETKALVFLTQPHTCSELGDHLWNEWHHNDKVYARHNYQVYARPAGRLIKRLMKQGKVYEYSPVGYKGRAAMYQTVS